MRKLKYILIFLIGLIVLVVMLIAVAVVMLDNEDYKKIITMAVRHYTDYEVSFEGDFEFDLSIEPTLDTSNIQVRSSPGALSSPISNIGRLKIKIALQQLFTGFLWFKELMVEDVRISMIIGEEKGRQKKEERRDVFIPILENVILRNIILDLSDIDKGHLFDTRLHQFTIDRDLDSGLGTVRGDGKADDYDFDFKGQIGSLTNALDAEPYPIALNLKSQGLAFQVNGKIDDVIEGEGFDLYLKTEAEAKDLSNVMELFQLDFPGLGHLKLEVHISGDVEALKASDIDITISDQQQTFFSATGSIRDLLNRKGVDLEISCTTENNDLIKILLPEIMMDFNKLEIDGVFLDHQGEYMLDNIVAHSTNDQGLAMEAGGLLNFGTLTSDLPLKSIDLQLRLDSQTTEAAKRFLVDILPEMGAVKATGRLAGPVEEMSLEDLSIHIGESQPLQLKSNGRIARIPIDDSSISGLDLTLTLQAEKSRVLTSTFDLPFPELGLVSATSQILYSDDQLQFKTINLNTTHAQGLKVGLSGDVNLDFNEPPQSPDDIQMEIRITAPNLGAAEPILGTRVLSTFGPVTGEARIMSDTKTLSLEDLSVIVGQSDQTIMEWQGRIGKSGLSGDQSASDIEIRASIKANETADFAALAGITLPKIGPLDGAWRLIDCKGNYCIDDLNVTIGQKDKFHMSVDGGIDSILRKDSISLDGIDFNIVAESSDISLIPVMSDLGLSNLGAFYVKARMTHKENHLDLKTFFLRTGLQEKPTVTMQGEVLGIEAPEKANMNITFETTTKPWIETYTEQSVTEDRRIHGSLRLTGLADNWRIHKLTLTAEEPDNFSLKTTGAVMKLKDAFKTDLKLTVNSKEPSFILSTFGISLPSSSPMSIDGEFKAKGAKSNFDGELRFGKTRFKTTVGSEIIRDQIPTIHIQTATDALYLPDFERPSKEEKGKRLFRRFFEPFRFDKKSESKTECLPKGPLDIDMFKGFNMSLSIYAEKLIGKNVQLDNLKIDMSLDDGLLVVRPSGMRHEEGEISLEAVLDTRKEKPDIMVKASAEDVDLDALLHYMDRPVVLGGFLNLVTDIRGSGNSLYEMAASLNGNIGFSVENGKIKRDIELLSADAFDTLTSLPKMDKYRDLNCLTLRFIFEDGLGKSQIMFLDTPNVRSRGLGTIDFKSDTLDFVIQPKPKKGLSGLNSAIRIQGPICDPKIRALPFKEAARLYGEILAPYVFLPARGLGYLWYLLKGDKEETPCLNLDAMPAEK